MEQYDPADSLEGAVTNYNFKILIIEEEEREKVLPEHSRCRHLFSVAGTLETLETEKEKPIVVLVMMNVINT